MHINYGYKLMNTVHLLKKETLKGDWEKHYKKIDRRTDNYLFKSFTLFLFH